MSATGTSTTRGIHADAQAAIREDIIALLTKAYWMELETVMNYVAGSVNPDGVHAQEVIEALATDVDEELGHARRLAQRIKELYGTVPGSRDFRAEQKSLQPPADTTDLAHIVRGVIEAETAAIEHYNLLVEVCGDADPVTQDMIVDILRDEEGHRRLFEGFLREFDHTGRIGR